MNWFAKFYDSKFKLDEKPRSGRGKVMDEELQKLLDKDATQLSYLSGG